MTDELAYNVDGTLLCLGSEIVEINRANDWDVTTPEDWAMSFVEDSDRKYKIPNKLALAHSEISEALEAYRGKDRDGFIEEMADAIIRIIDCTHGLGMNVGAAIIDKLEINRRRGFRHGGKVV